MPAPSDNTIAGTGRIDLERLLSPRSVVIVGASPTPGALGASVLGNLERGGFKGEIYLVNPKRDTISGRPCVHSIEQLPEGIDAAVLAIPRAGVIGALRELAKKKTGGAVIFSAGFAEGGDDGLAEQHTIARIARESGMAVEGPNCLGFVNNKDGVALTFVETPAADLGDGDGVAIVSQSGAMAAVLQVTLASKDLGVTLSVSTGNEAATGVQDYVDYLIDDPRTRVISMIVEQFRDPARFLDLANKAREKGKTIILLHPGKSEAARQSAATHTGAMAGDYALMRSLVEHHGVIMADTLEHLGDLTELAMRSNRFHGKGGAAILTESGAFKALSLDLAEEVGLDLPEMHDADSPAMRSALPDFVPVSNPVDLTAQALVDPELYQRAIAALVGDDRVGSILLGIIQTDPATAEKKLPAIIAAIETLKPDKPVIYAGLDEGADVPPEYIRKLRALGVACYPTAERAIRAVSTLSRASMIQAPVRPCVRKIDVSLPGGAGVVPEYRSKAILREAGLAFPAGRFAESEDAAAAAAEAIGYPVVLKAQSAELSHKSDAGGVVLGVKSEAELRRAFKKMCADVGVYSPGLKLDGVLVEKMTGKGVEMIVGARRDVAWGPVILVGFGGVQAEVLRDFRLLPPDLSLPEIREELLLPKSAKLLTGFRGSVPVDLDALCEMVSDLGALMMAQPRIVEVDLNPVVLRAAGQGLDILDALILLDA